MQTNSEAYNLQDLKKALEKCQQDLNQQNALLEIREDELKKIQTLKERIEANLLRMHHLSKINPKKSESLKLQIEEDTERITQHKRNLTRIDHHIENLGEENEEVFPALKKKLICTIYEIFPESVPKYEALEKKLKDAHLQKESLLFERKWLLPFFAYLKEGSAINLEGKFYDFIFGKNPKAQLARKIQQAILGAETALAHVQQTEIKNFLFEFLREAKNPSNKEIYNGKFRQFFNAFSPIMAKIELDINHVMQSIKENGKKLEDWIDHHCNMSYGC